MYACCMFSLPAPPARRDMSRAFSLIMPRLNSSLGSSELPALIVSFNFWLCWAISRSLKAAALPPEGAEADNGKEGVDVGIVGGCGCVGGGCVAGVEEVDAVKGTGAGVAGVVPGFRNEEKPLMVVVLLVPAVEMVELLQTEISEC